MNQPDSKAKTSAKMGPAATGLAIAASLILLLAYAFPLWTIDLFAPQYPEGLQLSIWIHKVAGDLENVNLLNHYVGMKVISPASIPELTLMPKVLAAIIATGLLAAASRRRWVVGLWLGLFLVLAIVGLGDFYRWEYNYGHELSPDAPIKVPGMAYQPPLIGVETLLNITIYSLPAIGGIVLGVSMALALAAIYCRELKALLVRKGLLRAVSTAALLLAFSAMSCTRGPKPIEVGHDSCDHCRMVISDARFGAELVTPKGLVRKFDSIDCMKSYVKDHGEEAGKAYVVDYFRSGQLVEAPGAAFFHSDSLHGPMGSGWIASASTESLNGISRQFSGKISGWDEVK